MYVNVVYSILENTSFKIINSLYIFPILFYIYLRDSEVVNEEKKIHEMEFIYFPTRL